MNGEITPSELREILEYDSVKGGFIWKVRARETFGCDRGWKGFNTRRAGHVAIYNISADGYRCGRATYAGRSQCFLAHRVAWAIYYGVWPDGQIDHINGNRLDNRITNLRVVLPAENNKNIGISRANTSGAIGVYWSPVLRKWFASIRLSKRQIYLGSYPSFELALARRKQAEREYGFNENHGSRRAWL